VPHRLFRCCWLSRSLSLSRSLALSLSLSLSLSPSRLHRPTLSLPRYHREGGARASPPAGAASPLLGAASLHDRGTARVAVAVSRARDRLLVAARLKRVHTRVAELDIDLGRVAAGSRQGRRRIAAGSRKCAGSVCAVWRQLGVRARVGRAKVLDLTDSLVVGAPPSPQVRAKGRGCGSGQVRARAKG
jgi:hypothetical protein